MNLSETPLDQIGAQAHGHYKVAEKASDKAEQNYKSAGIYLAEAKKRVLKTRGLTFDRFLRDHCPIGRSRAYEVIAIADGRKTIEEVREATNERKKKHRDEAPVRSGTDKHPEKPNEINERPSEVLREAERLRREIISILNRADVEQLRAIKRAIKR